MLFRNVKQYGIFKSKVFQILQKIFLKILEKSNSFLFLKILFSGAKREKQEEQKWGRPEMWEAPKEDENPIVKEKVNLKNKQKLTIKKLR